MPANLPTLSMALQQKFNPQGSDYDYARALSAGMGPTGTGANLGHWGSVAPVQPYERLQYALPKNSYVVLKGRDHPTFGLAVAAEEDRGSMIAKLGERYYSVPQGYRSPPSVPIQKKP